LQGYKISGAAHSYCCVHHSDKEKNMDILQKIFIAAEVIFVVGGLVWFFFLSR